MKNYNKMLGASMVALAAFALAIIGVMVWDHRLSLILANLAGIVVAVAIARFVRWEYLLRLKIAVVIGVSLLVCMVAAVSNANAMVPMDFGVGFLKRVICTMSLVLVVGLLVTARGTLGTHKVYVVTLAILLTIPALLLIASGSINGLIPWIGDMPVSIGVTWISLGIAFAKNEQKKFSNTELELRQRWLAEASMVVDYLVFRVISERNGGMWPEGASPLYKQLAEADGPLTDDLVAEYLHEMSRLAERGFKTSPSFPVFGEVVPRKEEV